MLQNASFDADELLVLARHHLQQGAVDLALGKLKLALALPDHPADTKLEAARLYAQLGLRSRSQPLFADYLSLNPDNVDVRFQLGMTLFEEGQPEAALAHWKMVLAAQPHYPPALFYGAVALLRLGQRVDARSQLKQLLETAAADNLYFGRARELAATIDAGESGLPAGTLGDARAYRTDH